MEKPHILLLYRAMIPSVRLCGHCQLEYLSGQGKVEYRAENAAFITGKKIQWADTVILGRLDNAYELELTKQIKKAGKQLLYIIDDDLLNVPAECSSSAYYGQKEIQGCIRSMMELCDGLISPSPLLFQKYLLPHQKGLWIEEPAIEPVPYTPHDGEVVKIGFAGSVDRTGDLQTLLGDVLRRLHEEYGEKVQFVFFGAIPDFAADLDAVSVSYQDSYLAYRQELNRQAWDIGLAPMPDTPFHACKHYNKFCEYAAAGIVGVFSDVAPYTRIAERYAGAVICSNAAEDWYRKLKMLIDDQQYRESLRMEVSRQANGVLSVPSCSEDFFRSAQNVLIFRSNRNKKICGLGFLRGKGYFCRIRNVWRKYGWGLFPAGYRKLCGKLKRNQNV